jgi:uncharacterized protein
VKPGKKHHYLRYEDKTMRIATRRAKEQSPEFKDKYRWRAGIEATMSEYDRVFKNYGKRIIKTSKLYMTDPSLVCFLTRQPAAESVLRGNMGGAIFEGLIVCEAWKVFLNHGKKPSLFFWRSQSGLEVDMIIQARGKLWPVEIKLTSTPSSHHTQPLDLFKAMAGKESSKTGLLVCKTDRSINLPGNNTALPWAEFSDWLAGLIK